LLLLGWIGCTRTPSLSIHVKYRTNEFSGYGWHILDDLGCFCTILATCDQIRQLQTPGTVDHEIVSVPIATAYLSRPQR
jgi:hypothetical protein